MESNFVEIILAKSSVVANASYTESMIMNTHITKVILTPLKQMENFVKNVRMKKITFLILIVFFESKSVEAQDALLFRNNFSYDTTTYHPFNLLELDISKFFTIDPYVKFTNDDTKNIRLNGISCPIDTTLLLKIIDSIHLIYIKKEAMTNIDNLKTGLTDAEIKIYKTEKILNLLLSKDAERRDVLLEMFEKLFHIQIESRNYKGKLESFSNSIETDIKSKLKRDTIKNNSIKRFNTLKKEFDTLQAHIITLNKNITTNENNWKKEKAEKEENSNDIIGALPQLAIKNKVAPSITLLGAREIKKLGTHKISLYTGNDNNFDTTMLAQLITPEISKYGLSISGIFNLRAITKDSNYSTVFNYLINLNSKNLGFTSVNDLEFTQLNIRVGAEKIIVDKILSLYGSFNISAPLSKRAEFLSKTKFINTTQYFMDFGIKILLGNKNINDFGYYIDLNFFNLTKDFQNLTQSEDSFGLNNIKVGLQKTF